MIRITRGSAPGTSSSRVHSSGTPLSPRLRAATEELVREVMERNEIVPEHMVSCIFTCTPDLDAEFPAVAARNLGLSGVPLLCTRELDVPGALPRVIRLMLHLSLIHI